MAGLLHLSLHPNDLPRSPSGEIYSELLGRGRPRAVRRQWDRGPARPVAGGEICSNQTGSVPGPAQLDFSNPDAAVPKPASSALPPCLPLAPPSSDLASLLQDRKSYEELKAELGEDSKFSQLTTVSILGKSSLAAGQCEEMAIGAELPAMLCTPAGRGY